MHAWKHGCECGALLLNQGNNNAVSLGKNNVVDSDQGSSHFGELPIEEICDSGVEYALSSQTINTRFERCFTVSF